MATKNKIQTYSGGVATALFRGAALLALMTVLISGCARHEVAATPKRIDWEYHVEKFESTALEDYSKLSEQRDKLPHDEWHTKLNNIEKSEARFYPQSKLDELGRQGWEMVSSYIEQQTVWPDISLAGPENRQPNMRGGVLVMIFKRPL